MKIGKNTWFLMEQPALEGLLSDIKSCFTSYDHDFRLYQIANLSS